MIEMRRLIMLVEGAAKESELFHVTSPANAESIYRTGFRASADGEAGPGVYLIDDPAALTADKFRDGVVIYVDVSVPILPVKDGVNRVLSWLTALYGHKQAVKLYDATRDRFVGSSPNWAWLQELARKAGYGGIRLIGHGSYKNTLVFDPHDVHPRKPATLGEGAGEFSGMPTAKRDPGQPVYLRIGGWNPDHPVSHNHARGDIETGLSCYDLDANGQPVIPEEGEWAEQDFHDRMRSGEPKYLVQGLLVGEGHDGEPLLGKPVIVGMWPDDL